MVKKSIRGGILHEAHMYVKANNRYRIVILMYCDVSNLYGWVLSHELPIESFKCKKKKPRFIQKIIQNSDNDSKKGCILEIDVNYPKHLNNLHNDLLFLPKK